MALNEFEYHGNGLWTQHVMDANGDVHRIVIIGFGNPDERADRSEEPDFRLYRVRIDTHELLDEFPDRSQALEAAYRYLGNANGRSPSERSERM